MVPAGASQVALPAARRRRPLGSSSSCARACAPAGRSSASRRTRARSATCCATCAAAASCGSSDAEAALFRLLDGRHTLPALVATAEQPSGSAGPGGARAAADRPLGARPAARQRAPRAAADAPRRGLVRRLTRPARRTSEAFGRFVDRIYARGGWLLFLQPVLRGARSRSAPAGSRRSCTSSRAATARRSSSPSHVGARRPRSSSAGASSLVTLHELAHGLACASFGRRVAPARASSSS